MALSKVPYDLLSGTASVSQLPAQLSINSGASSGSLAMDSAGRVTMPYQPAFRAYLSTSQNITTTSNTKINFDATVFNVGNHFDTTNNRFVAPIAGLYLFSVNHNTYNVTSGLNWRTIIYYNGSSLYVGAYMYSDASAADQNIVTTCVLRLNANDYIEAWSGSNDGNYNLSPGGSWNNFFGCLLS